MSEEQHQVTAGEEEAPPTEDSTLMRRWISFQNPSLLAPKDMAILNNLEFLSKQVSKVTEMLADVKIGPRSSRRSSDASSGRSSRAGEAEDNTGDEVILSLVTSDDFYSIFEAFITGSKYVPYIKRTKKTVSSAKQFRDAAVDQVKDLWDPDAIDEMCARLQSLEEDQLVELYIGLSKRHRSEKSSGKTKQVATVTSSFRTNVDREGSQDTEENTPTPRRRSSKRKANTPGGRRRIRRNIIDDDDDEEEEHGEASTTAHDEGSLFMD